MQSHASRGQSAVGALKKI